MTSSRRILAIVVIASSVSTFDYAIGRVDRAAQSASLREHRAVINRTAPSPYQYRILAPVLIEAGTKLAGRFMEPGVAFRRTLLLFDAIALMLLFATLYRYVRHWFSEERALIGVLLIACTVPIALRQHSYAPGSLLEPSLFAFGLSCIVEGRAGLIPIVTLVAALNRETAVLLPTALLIAAVDAKNRRRLISLAILSFVLWLATFASLRFFIGPAPAAITLHDIWNINRSPEGLKDAAVNIALFAGGVGWLLAVGGYLRAPAFVRRMSLLLLAYLPLIAIWGIWYEVRLLMPVYPLVVPLMLSCLYEPSRGMSATVDASG